MSEQVPQHLGIIMDGNRRWAKSQGLPNFEGHRKGYEKLQEVGEWCLDRGVKIITAYAFSIENWKRTADEVSYLMDLLLFALTKEIDVFMKRNTRLRIIGRREGLSDKLREAISAAEEQTKNNSRGTLQLAVNYGGQAEIADAVKSIVKDNIPFGAITEETVAQHLYAPEVPSPDLIIRTSGEQRLSGFLTWQAAYSELYFASVHWPAFSEEDLDTAFDWYANRDRRYGK